MSTVISPLTDTLSHYVARAVRKPLPIAVAEKTRHHVLDTLAAMVSGTQLNAGKRAIAYVKTLGGAKQACIAGTRLVTSAANAAMTNGMLAHADETDDSHPASLTHPGCSTVSAALAAAELNQSSGAAFLRAVALGYDVGTRLAMSLNPMQFRADGHANMGFGPMLGATAAAAALAGFNARQVRYTFSYAAQQAGGIASYTRDTGHVEKAFVFGGMPARNAVTAAMLVAQGCTGVDDVFSGERNFYAAFGRDADPGTLARELGARYEIMNTNIKRWSVGGPIQAALDALFVLVHGHAIAPATVERVVVRVSHSGANTVNNRSMPDICMQHLCAIMLLDRNVSFDAAHDARRMCDRKVLALRARVLLEGDDELERALPSRQAVVRIRLNDGREFMHHTAAVRGTRYDPMSRAEICAKSFDLMSPVLGGRQTRLLCDTVMSLDQLNDMRNLRALLQA